MAIPDVRFSGCCDWGIQCSGNPPAGDALWSNDVDTGKLYRQSGGFTATIADSLDVSGSDPAAICWDGTNTPSASRRNSGGSFDPQVVLFSGQFTTTIKDSQSTSVVSTPNSVLPGGVSWDGTNTPFIGEANKSTDQPKLYLLSQQFTSTVITSQLVASTAYFGRGISWNAGDTPYSCELRGGGVAGGKLWENSGQFSSTIRDSVTFSAKDITDISWDGTNTMSSERGTGLEALFIVSGHFTSTIKESVSLSVSPFGVNTTATTTG